MTRVEEAIAWVREPSRQLRGGVENVDVTAGRLIADALDSERLRVLEDVFEALTSCPIYALFDGRLGMAREEVSAALASLNGGVVPMRRD